MKFENTEVWGFEHALRGMRNPKNSHDRSDSFMCLSRDDIDCPNCPASSCTLGWIPEGSGFVIGENDMKLCQSLIKGGSEHRKFLRQIFVSVDITAPLYWFKEFDTYKVGTTANSTSTMHKLATNPITLDCFEVDDFNPDLKVFDNEPYNYDEYMKECAETIIDICETLRERYIITKDKRYWKELIRWLPEGWLQTRTVTMNYENIYNMVHQRKNHKLNEWSGQDNHDLSNFIDWAKELPYAKEFIFMEE